MERAFYKGDENLIEEKQPGWIDTYICHFSYEKY